MEKGDISNSVPFRILIVGNDYLVKVPEIGNPFFGGRGFGKTKRLVERLDIDMDIRAQLHDITWRRDLRCDVVMMGWDHQMCELLHKRFDNLNLAISAVYPVTDVQELVRRMAYMPEVMYIVHNNPAWGLAFGPRGRMGLVGI